MGVSKLTKISPPVQVHLISAQGQPGPMTTMESQLYDSSIT